MGLSMGFSDDDLIYVPRWNVKLHCGGTCLGAQMLKSWKREGHKSETQDPLSETNSPVHRYLLNSGLAKSLA